MASYMVTSVVTDFIHIAGDLQHFLDKVGVKVPRALCGVSLADPNVLGYDSPGGYGGFSPCTLTPIAVPVCPTCAQTAGWAWCSIHGDYEPGEVCSDIGDGEF
jgi:hypothetical protein